jgi:hypothetical protein
VLCGEHARGECVGGVAGFDRHLGLRDDGAVVERLGHEMHRCTRDRVARRDGSRVGVEALVFRQQRRMDVEDAACPVLDESGREQTHIAGERDHLGVGFAKRGVDLGFVLRLRAPLWRRGKGCDPLFGGPGEAGGLGLVAGDEHHVIACARLAAGGDQRLHVRTAAGQENADARTITHGDASRSRGSAPTRSRRCR